MKSKWETDLVKVLFVCTGNICRSPTAEGVFRKFVNDAGVGDKIFVDSAANLRILSELCPSDLASRISLFLDYAPSLKRREVPDPYHGGGKGFELVLDLIEAASNGLLSHIRSYDL